VVTGAKQLEALQAMIALVMDEAQKHRVQVIVFSCGEWGVSVCRGQVGPEAPHPDERPVGRGSAAHVEQARVAGRQYAVGEVLVLMLVLVLLAEEADMHWVKEGSSMKGDVWAGSKQGAAATGSV